MRVPYHGRVRTAHIVPAFEPLVIGVDQGPHHGSDIEWMLATGILLLREQISHAGEIAILGSRTECHSKVQPEYELVEQVA